MRTNSILHFAALLAVTACGAERPETLSDAQRRAVADSVAAAIRSYEGALSALDVERILSFYAPDSQFRLIENGEESSFEVFASHVRQAMPALRRLDAGFDSIQPHVLSRDVVVMDAIGRSAFTDASGMVARVRSTATMVWVRGPAGWRIAHFRGESGPDTSRTR